MKITIIQSRTFAKTIDKLLGKKQLLQEDFDDLKKTLAEKPTTGDLIPGTGGIRKIRLKSPSKGKSGGFRVCYFDDQKDSNLYLLLIYPKSSQQSLTPAEKKILKETTKIIKGN